MDYKYTRPTESGWNYTGQGPGQTKLKNALTGEEISKLFQKGNSFSLAITEMERLRAICTHRFENGMDALQDLGGGAQRCQICGHDFMPISTQTSKEEIQAIVDQFKDTLQTIKLLYLDMPTDAAREFFVLIALADKVPDLFECACKDYIRHERFMPGVYGNRAANVLSIYNMIMGGAGPETYMQFDQAGRPIDPGFSQNSAWAYGNPIYNYDAWGRPLGNGQANFGQPFGFAGSNGFVAGQAGTPDAYQAETQNYKYDPMTGKPIEKKYKYDPMTGKPLDPNETAKVTEVQSTFKA